MDRRKELLAAYKQSRPQMGIVAFICRDNNHVYLSAAKNTKTCINSLSVRLSNNMYTGSRNGHLQEDWNAYGEAGFDIKVVDTLDYDKDESKTDYTQELSMLLEDWQVKFPGAEVILGRY